MMKDVMVKGVNMTIMIAWMIIKMGWIMFLKSPFSWPLRLANELWVRFVFIFLKSPFSWPLRLAHELWVRFVFVFLKYEMESINAQYVIPFEYYNVRPIDKFLVERGRPLPFLSRSESGSNVMDNFGQHASCGSGENSDAQSIGLCCKQRELPFWGTEQLRAGGGEVGRAEKGGVSGCGGVWWRDREASLGCGWCRVRQEGLVHDWA
ncbi:hypothetical protein Tco_0629564 [Tanacetum coccineum]|uniref:Transmembrane protein n=1 Tax=Tanacetum coccineum TaxID=301880 RepID=A0ABQ4WTJ7_9ASTR